MIPKISIVVHAASPKHKPVKKIDMKKIIQQIKERTDNLFAYRIYRKLLSTSFLLSVWEFWSTAVSVSGLFKSIDSSSRASNDTLNTSAKSRMFSSLGSVFPFSQSETDWRLIPYWLDLDSFSPRPSCERPRAFLMILILRNQV